MHRHGTQQSANACSRFCAANKRDQDYYARHGHYADVAPVSDCTACQEQRRRAEERRKAEKGR